MKNPANKKVILYGNGSVAQTTYFYFTHDSPYQVAAFTIDRQYLKEDTLLELPVVPFENIDEIFPPEEFDMHIAVGHVRINRIRAEKYERAKALGY